MTRWFFDGRRRIDFKTPPSSPLFLRGANLIYGVCMGVGRPRDDGTQRPRSSRSGAVEPKRKKSRQKRLSRRRGKHSVNGSVEFNLKLAFESRLVLLNTNTLVKYSSTAITPTTAIPSTPPFPPTTLGTWRDITAVMVAHQLLSSAMRGKRRQ